MTCIVCDKRTSPPGTGHDYVDYYGGHLIAESIPPAFAALIVARMNATMNHPDFQS